MPHPGIEVSYIGGYIFGYIARLPKPLSQPAIFHSPEIVSASSIGVASVPRGISLYLALPVFDVSRLFHIRVDFVLMVEVVRQGRMDLGRGQVAEALEDFVNAHAELVISCDAVDGDPRACDDRPSIGNAGIRRDIGVIKFSGCLRHISPSLAANRSPLHSPNISRKQSDFAVRIDKIGASVN